VESFLTQAKKRGLLNLLLFRRRDGRKMNGLLDSNPELQSDSIANFQPNAAAFKSFIPNGVAEVQPIAQVSATALLSFIPMALLSFSD